MPFTSYDTLLSTIADWLDREDLNDQIADFVWLSECDLQRTIKFRMRDEITTGSTKDGEEWITMPDDYAEGGLIRWPENINYPTLEITSYDLVDQVHKTGARVGSAQPIKVSFLHGQRVYLGFTPGEVAYEIFYKAGVRHLGAEYQSNVLLEQYPDTLLYGALMHSAPFLGADERLSMWEKKYNEAKEETRMAEWRARSGHGALRMRPDVQVL